MICSRELIISFEDMTFSFEYYFYAQNWIYKNRRRPSSLFDRPRLNSTVVQKNATTTDFLKPRQDQISKIQPQASSLSGAEKGDPSHKFCGRKTTPPHLRHILKRCCAFDGLRKSNCFHSVVHCNPQQYKNCVYKWFRCLWQK